MRTYIIGAASEPLPPLSGEFDPSAEAFCAGEYAAIDRYAWGGDYRPEARAWLRAGGAALHVLLCAREETVSARVRDFGGPVWTDSCLEFFFQPFEGDPRYMNIEVNAAGAALIGIGAGREGRRVLAECPGGMDIRASRHAGAWWAVAYSLPYALIGALFARAFRPGGVARGNFYKCDESIHPHFGSWNPIDAPAPDFHRPECFGALVFGE
ncbi:MAG: hypothetical protein IKN05_08980 [Clostridia bacterium]|nr:hypothetical protein [Clostridia bacterium]